MEGNMATEFKDLPYEVRAFIERQHRAEIDGNQCDYRPTSQSALDSITERVIARHETGVEWLKTIPASLKGQCHAVYNMREQYGGHDLTQAKLDGRWVLVPRYLTLIDEARKLAAIFAPTSGVALPREPDHKGGA
jgi:hypothetical protein